MYLYKCIVINVAQKKRVEVTWQQKYFLIIFQRMFINFCLRMKLLILWATLLVHRQVERISV